MGTDSPAGWSLGEIAEIAGGTVAGDPGFRVSRLCPIGEAGPSELGFLADRRYLERARGSAPGAVLVSTELSGSLPEGVHRVIVSDPHGALKRLVRAMHPPSPREVGIHPSATFGPGVRLGEAASIGPGVVVGEGCRIGDRVSLGAHVVVGAGVRIGDDTVLHPHVVLYPGVEIGARVILHAGVRVGVDGFGYAPGSDGFPERVPHVGGCRIEDDVEIGANSTIDRGSIGATVIGRGSKLDNLVHIAHNVRIGPGCILTAQVGIAGSTSIGAGSQFGGQSGVIGHLEVAPGTRVAAKSGVMKDVERGELLSGIPARPNAEYLRAMAELYRIGAARRELERRIAQLEGAPAPDR